MRKSMSLKTLSVAGVPVLALSLGGCSWLGIGSGPNYQNSQSPKALAMPPNLTAPKTTSTYAIPSGKGLGPAEHHQTSQPPSASGTSSQPTPNTSSSGQNQPLIGTNGKRKNTTAVQPQSGVVPVAKDIHLVSKGTTSWLNIHAAPGSVWPHVVHYFKAKGFKLAKADAKTGVIRTKWQGSQAGIPKGLTSHLFKSLYDSGKRERYVVRVVSHNNGKATLLYMTYEGAVEKNIGSGAMHWQWAKPDPGKTASELQALMNYLAAHLPAKSHPVAEVSSASTGQGSQSTIKPGSVKTGSASQSSPSKTSAGAGNAHTNPANYKIVVANQESVMRSSLPFATAWPQIGVALHRASFTINKADKSKGLYYVKYNGPSKNNIVRDLLSANQLISMGSSFVIRVRQHKSGVQIEVDNPMMLPVQSDGAGDVLKMIRAGMVGPHQRAATNSKLEKQRQQEARQAASELKQAETQASKGKKYSKITYHLTDESHQPVIKAQGGPYSIVWSQVGLALLHSHYVIQSSNQAKSIYQVVYTGKNQGAVSGNFLSNFTSGGGGPVLIHGVRFRIYVQRVGKQDVWIKVQTPMGLPVAAHGARQVLKSIQPNLG